MRKVQRSECSGGGEGLISMLEDRDGMMAAGSGITFRIRTKDGVSDTGSANFCCLVGAGAFESLQQELPGAALAAFPKP